MSAETNIEWCDSTFNPWIGCTRISPACDALSGLITHKARAEALQDGLRALLEIKT